jgi:hypothetical protein
MKNLPWKTIHFIIYMGFNSGLGFPHYSLLMSNLVPEPRQDKNGKIVIRHVKVDVNGSTINIPIPAPRPITSQPTNSDPIEALCGDLSYAVMEATMDFDNLSDDPEGENDLAREGIYDHLKTYPDELVTTLENIRLNDDGLFHELARRVEQRESPRFVSNMIAYREVAGEDEDQKVAFVRSLGHYQQLDHYPDLRTGGPDADSKVRGLIQVASAILDRADEDDAAEEAIDRKDHEYDFEAAPVIRNEDLIDFVLENHERASDIAKVIRERSVYTPEEIRIVLDHPETALSDGAL